MLNITHKWKYNSWLFAMVLLICFLISVEVRFQQFETWKNIPSNYFVGETPLMTTLDAPFWLRIAREYNEGVYKQKSHLRGYPEGTNSYKELYDKELSIPAKYIDSIPVSSSSSHSSSGIPKFQYRDVPLLSFLIAHFAPFFKNNYYLTGTMLIPILASLFIVPMGIYFFRISVPLSGLVGGLIATFAGGYYMRSSIGRIDTDMLNLFFPMVLSLLILLASLAKTVRSIFLFSMGAGLSLFLFQWWYSKPVFTLAYFVFLVLCLFVHQIRYRTILLSLLLFLLCVQPSTFMGGTVSALGQLSRYLLIEEVASNTEIFNETAPASFPNTMTTISEVDHLPMDEVLRRVLSNTMFGWVGLIAFFVFALLRWQVLLPLLPMLALGLLSFQSSNRFIMYLAPFIGIGLGWLLQLGIEAVFYFLPWKRSELALNEFEEENNHGKQKMVRRIGSILAILKSIIRISADNMGNENKKCKEEINKEKVKDEGLKIKDSLWNAREFNWFGWTRQGTLYLGMGFFFWLISSQTAISFVPGPSIHPRIYSTFLEIKKRIPKESVLITWWDYGYAITDVTGMSTFHDGGLQFSPKTYFIARSLISPDQEELYDTTQFLATQGNRGIAENNTSPEALLAAVRDPEHKPWDPIYLFFTADMTGKYGAISKLGSWNIEKGGSKPRAYQNLACNKITNEQMNCRGANINLKDGFINNHLSLYRIIFIRNGKVLREQKFKHNQGFTLQLIVAGNNIVEVQLIDEEVFSSNYNQMFLLGRYREDLFEEAYNAFPFSRLYRIKY